MAIIFTIFLLNSNAVTFRRDKSILFNRSLFLILIFCLYKNYQTSIVNFLTEATGLFGGLFNVTSITHSFNNFYYFISALILQLTAFLPRQIWVKIHENIYFKFFYNFIHNTNFFNKMAEQFRILEYPLIILFIIVGGIFFMSCGDVVSIFLSIELQSYGLYILATIYKYSELSTSAGLTYFLLGSLSSTFVLLGSGLFYANSGSTGLDGHYIMTAVYNLMDTSESILTRLYNLSYLDTILLIVGVGFLFKISAAPFHFWSPDVYDAIPTIVTTFVAIIAKISILVLLLELVHFTTNLAINTEFNWGHSILLSCFLSFIVGSVLGLSQPRVKKLLAYSTISHIGFILLAIGINTLESIEAFIFYLVQYSLSNVNIFFILLAIGYSLFALVYENETIYEKESGNLPERNNSPIQLITELKGYFYINPILALSMAITLFSFIGIPPLMGFFAKQMVLLSALNNGYIFLVIIAILTSVISASYYLNIIKEIFFENSSLVLNKEFINKTFTYKLENLINLVKIKTIVASQNIGKHKFDIYNLILSSYLSFTISNITILLLLFMLASQEWLRLNRVICLLIFET